MEKNTHIELLRTLIGKSGKDVSPSPYMQWLNGMLLDVAKGYAKVKFPVKENMLNPANILHGGVLSGMLDEVAGIAVYSLQNEYFYSTLNLSIDFLRSAHKSSDIIVEGKVIRHGTRIIHVEVELFQDDELKAKATTNLILLNHRIPQTRANIPFPGETNT